MLEYVSTFSQVACGTTSTYDEPGQIPNQNKK